MRQYTVLLLLSFTFILFSPIKSFALTESQSIIIEVEGDPKVHQKYIEDYFPYVEVIMTYDTLFQGMALKAPTDKLAKIPELSFVQAVHPVQLYEAHHTLTKPLQDSRVVFPKALNTTSYTGKGIKVGVIDTGIDYDHPDLVANYKGGYDLVDLDEDPMETKGGEGIATSHGTHVAGIIAANGKLKGVAENAEIYAYRALGPGGVGSSIQVIAALEQALKDDVDIINLSLGNLVNGPDYPTSIAVNRAAELGVAIVIANGNNGPDHWTIGAPATATKALSVGATAPAEKIALLDIGLNEKPMPLLEMHGSVPWRLSKDYQIAELNEQTDMTGKIALAERGDISFYEKAKQAEENGAVAVLIYNNEPDGFQGSISDEHAPIKIPVAALSREDGLLLKDKLGENSFYIDTKYTHIDKSIAPFSSRGPVTVNWQIKPDVLAPGTHILSTVPNGYQTQQGTSMAAPHVAGAIALVKEAHPKWSNEQIIGALKTTAKFIEENDGIIEPINQGMGEIQIEQAINTKTIIMNPLLSFGKINNYRETETINLIIENTTTEDQQYYFSVPKKQRGLTWDLPQSFTIRKNERKKVPVTLSVTTQQLEDDIHQGVLTLHQATEKFELPYLFINKTADFPRAMGFEFYIKLFKEDIYTYKLYVTEEVKNISIHLYERDTLIYDRQLLKLKAPTIGMNEGEIKKSKVGMPGYYIALINVALKDGTYKSYETELYIPDEREHS